MITKHFLSPEPRSQLFRIIVLTAILTKSFLAAITPSSFDFINIVYGTLFVSNGAWFQGPYTFSVIFMNLFYRLWLLIPIDHNWIYSDHVFIPSASGFLLLFMFKLPLLVLDILTSLLIYKCVSLLTTSKRLATFAMLVWLLNPYLTVAIEMDGTIDIISTFLIVWATYLFICNRHAVSGVVLAVATMARFYPIFLIPFFAFFVLKERRIRNFCLMITAYFASLAAAVIPFVATYGTDFLNTLYQLPAGGNKEFIWFFGFRPSVASTSGTEISSVMTVSTVLGLLVWRVWKTDRRLILDVILIVLITYVGLSHFNRYYTIWVVPFLTMDLAMNWDKAYGNVCKALYTLFFLSAFVYNFAYWWAGTLAIYEFTPQVTEVGAFMREIGSMLRTGDLGTTFSQSVLAGTCIIYATMVAMRRIVRNRNQRGNVNCNPCEALMVVKS